MALAVDQHRVHRPAAIVDRGIPDDLDKAGLRIDLDLADRRGVGVGRDAHRLVGNTHQRSAQIGRNAVAECRGGDLEQADGAIGPLYDKALLRKFDILLGGFEHRAGDPAPLLDDLRPRPWR